MFDWWYELLLQIALWILQLIDGIYKLFLVLAGAAPASIMQEVTGSGSENILDAFFNNSTVQYVFWAFMVISFFILFLAIIIGVARSQLSDDNKQSKLKVFKRSAISIITVLAMPALVGMFMAFERYNRGKNYSIGVETVFGIPVGFNVG